MADTSENPEVPEAEQVTTPQTGDLGKQLRHCREKAGLDIEQAASEMRLSPHLLRSLEEEDFQTLPEPPYIRGYLRSYARLSDSTPNTLIELYDTLRGGNTDYTTQFTPLKSIEHVAKPRISSFTIKLIGLLLLIAVLGGLSMMPDVRAWANNLWTSFSEKVEGTTTDATTSDDETGNTTDSTETSAPNDTDNSADNTTTNAISIPSITTTASEDTSNNKLAGTIQRDADEATSDDVTTAASSDENTDGADTTAVAESNAPNASDTTDEQSDSTSDNSPADAEDKNTDNTDTAENNEESETRAENNAENDVNNDAENSDGIDTTKQPIDGKVTIRMDFEQEVWLEIRNNEDKAIFETLKSSGRQELQAHTPLKFKVGNAPGVKIYLNGVLFDQKPHTRGNVAKFEVK